MPRVYRVRRLVGIVAVLAAGVLLAAGCAQDDPSDAGNADASKGASTPGRAAVQWMRASARWDDAAVRDLSCYVPVRSLGHATPVTIEEPSAPARYAADVQQDGTTWTVTVQYRHAHAGGGTFDVQAVRVYRIDGLLRQLVRVPTVAPMPVGCCR